MLCGLEILKTLLTHLMPNMVLRDASASKKPSCSESVSDDGETRFTGDIEEIEREYLHNVLLHFSTICLVH